jgi:hemerythrin
MALLSWSSKYSVGVQSMDRQHTVLFDILNELHTAMMKGQAQAMTGSLLQKLVNYTRNHFSAEESMMAASGYPGLAQHRTRHRDLMKQVEEFVARHKRGESTLNVQLLNFLRDWLTNHIQHEDQQYGPWLNGRGVH